MNSPSTVEKINVELEFIKEEIELVINAIATISESDGNDLPLTQYAVDAISQQQKYINDLNDKLTILRGIVHHLSSLLRIIEAAGTELSIINEFRHISAIARDGVERIPDGTPVTLEVGTGGKSEFLDGEIIGYADGKPCVRTYFERIYNHCDPSKVKVREEVANG